MIDLAARQLSQMHRERRALIASHVDRDKFIIKCRAKEYPEGSTHQYALDAVYGPIGSKENGNAAR